MHFRDVVTTLPSTSNVKGDIVVVGANPTGKDPSGNTLVQGQEYIWTSTTSTGISYWELIGDQGTYATKAYVDANVSSLNSNKAQIGSSIADGGNGISGQVVLYSNAKPSLTITVSPTITASALVA